MKRLSHLFILWQQYKPEVISTEIALAFPLPTETESSNILAKVCLENTNSTVFVAVCNYMYV